MEVDEECAEKASILKNLLASVKCGCCLISYATIQELHSHLTNQEQGGSYIYNHETKMAYHLNPRVSSFVQTEVMVEYEESCTQTDITVTCADSAPGSYTNGSPVYDIYVNTLDLKYELPVSQENIYLHSDGVNRSYEIGEKLDQINQDMDTHENTDLYFPYSRHSTDRIEYSIIKTEIDTENSYGEDQTIGLREAKKKGNHSMRLRNKKGPYIWEKEKHAQEKCKTPLRPDKRRKFKRQARQLNKTETVRKKIKMIIRTEKSLNSHTLSKVIEQDLDSDNLGTFKEKNKIHHSVKDRKRNTCTKKVYRIIKKADEDQSSSVKKKHSNWLTCLACNKKVMILENHIERYHYHNYPLQCDQCFHPFKNETEADRHNCSVSAVLYRHHCLQCPDKKSFRFRANLRTHIKNCHNNVLPLKCDKCHIKLVSKFEEREHIATHDKSTLICCFCQQQCVSVAELDRHLVSHKSPEEAFHCSEQFQPRSNLQEHIIPQPGDSQSDEDDSDKNSEEEETEKDGRVCDKCGDMIPYKKFKDHLKYECSEKIHECYICNKKFERKSGLTGHLKTHSKKRPRKVIICERCGQSFTNTVTLKNHMKFRHTYERDRKCSMCEKAFVTSSSLERHKRVHLKIRNYQCDQCEKSFSTNWNLKAHRRQHTGDTPYKCSKCGDGFAHNVVRKHHEEQCNRYYVCNLKAEVETSVDSKHILA